MDEESKDIPTLNSRP